MSSSCSQHSTPFLGSYVPSFVKEAVSIQKFELVRHGSEGIVDFKIYFTAKSLQSKAEFDRIQGNNSADDKSNKIIVRGRCTFLACFIGNLALLSSAAVSAPVWRTFNAGRLCAFLVKQFYRIWHTVDEIQSLLHGKNRKPARAA